MAKGSQQFAWKLYPELPHVCIDCHRDLKRDDVGEYGRWGYRCTTCISERVARSIRRTRVSLGLEEAA